MAGMLDFAGGPDSLGVRPGSLPAGDENIIGGILHMASAPYEGLVVVPAWGEILANRMLVAVAVVLFLFNINNIFRLMPPLLYSLARPGGSVGLEYNISIATLRNRMALLSLLPCALVFSRYGIACPDAVLALDAQWHSLAVLAIIAAYALFRSLCYAFIMRARLSRDERLAARRSAYSIFILAVLAILLIAAVIAFAGVSDKVALIAIASVLAVFFVSSVLRSGQILAQHCGALRAFLYLCGLEILPLAVLVAGVEMF